MAKKRLRTKRKWSAKRPAVVVGDAFTNGPWLISIESRTSGAIEHLDEPALDQTFIKAGPGGRIHFDYPGSLPKYVKAKVGSLMTQLLG